VARKQNSTAKRCVVLTAARSGESCVIATNNNPSAIPGRSPSVRPREEADERRPRSRRAPFAAASKPARSSGSASSSGSGNVIANVEPDASVATCRNVLDETGTANDEKLGCVRRTTEFTVWDRANGQLEE
jgi:hypothetical protein